MQAGEEKTFAIEGMHCKACEQKLTAALESLPALDRVDVSLSKKQARLHAQESIELDTLREAVASAGEYQLVSESENGATRPGQQTSETGSAQAQDETDSESGEKESLYPLLLIVAYILGSVILIAIATRSYDWMTMMRHFMAGFFIVFSFFKLLDPPGFVDAYMDYDLLAQRDRRWARAYPFVELFLGVWYALYFAPLLLNLITLALMLIGAAGVARALLDRQKIRCACLGTALNLPMTKVTLIEDLTMAAMAGIMLFNLPA